MKIKIALPLFSVAVVALLAGCASTTISNRQQLVTGPIPRPAHIWVHDFTATAADLPADSALAGQPDVDTTPQTAEQIEAGRQLGAQIAAQLVEQIRAMGLPAEQTATEPPLQVNDLLIRGYLISVQEGDATKRVVIGFGQGASELKTAVEGFQMTANGLRKIGSGNLDAGGNKSPGAALGVIGLIATANPAGLIISGGMHVYAEKSGSSTVEGRAKQTAKEIAEVLKKRFQGQGWIP